MDTDSPDEIVFDLPSGKITVREADLDAIRRAVSAYVRSSSEQLRDTFADELDGAMVWIDEEGVGRINQWLLERRGDHLALVRYPPRGPVMILFAANLAKEADQPWKVSSFRQERMRGR